MRRVQRGYDETGRDCPVGGAVTATQLCVDVYEVLLGGG